MHARYILQTRIYIKMYVYIYSYIHISACLHTYIHPSLYYAAYMLCLVSVICSRVEPFQGEKIVDGSGRAGKHGLFC